MNALDYTYRYQQPSVVEPHRLSLVTSLDHPAERFFEGHLLQPQRTAELLLGVTDVVRSRFHTPPAMMRRILLQADPVITCDAQGIRFEGFSACASVYVRLDLDQTALDGDMLNRGTTNVDFNTPMRAALAGVRATEPVRLSVGMRDVSVETAAGPVIERKVQLPVRWVKSFAEVALYQARMRPWSEVPGAVFRRFLRDLPSEAKGEFWLTQGSLRLTQRPVPGAMAVGGITRLRMLSALARHADSVCIYDGGGQATAWELRAPGARFQLVLSADVWRGFSGEGQALFALASQASRHAVTRIRASLRWQGTVEDADEAALARCAALGLLGYDLHARAWFHRELPFDISRIDGLNPRLAAARKLTEEVEIEERSADRIQAWVRSKETHYRVLAGENASCTCPWFSKHGLSRGPCKHILAVEMACAER
jgi:hypothetical protein